MGEIGTAMEKIIIEGSKGSAGFLFRKIEMKAEWF